MNQPFPLHHIQTNDHKFQFYHYNSDILCHDSVCTLPASFLYLRHVYTPISILLLFGPSSMLIPRLHGMNSSEPLQLIHQHQVPSFSNVQMLLWQQFRDTHLPILMSSFYQHSHRFLSYGRASCSGSSSPINSQMTFLVRASRHQFNWDFLVSSTFKLFSHLDEHPCLYIHIQC